MTCRLLITCLLAGCCVAMAGCLTPKYADQTEPSVRYLSLDAPYGMSQAVVVEGYPLVHTRQLLPLDAEGNLVGDGSADRQIEQVFANLEAVLNAAGSDLEKIVRLNVYVDSPQTADSVRERFGTRSGPLVCPAITAVVSPLPHPQALVAVDAVAIAADQGDAVALVRCESVAGDDNCADAAVMPPRGVVYLSGQPDKSPLAEATVKSLTALLKIVDQLELARSQIAHVKVFVESAAAADQVRDDLKRMFPGQLAPPVVFVEWIASAPVEIEMILHLPLPERRPAETVRYYTPPGVKASPTFSRVALVETDRHIYISGLSARAPGDGEAQVRDVFAQLEQVLSATGSDLGHLAKATYYVSDDDASTMLNKIRPEFYDPERPPAASKVMVHGIAQSDRTLTIDMIAVGSGP